jgi:polyhydroxybutyrate depolymerase
MPANKEVAMRKILVWLGAALALVMVTGAILAWWFLSFDTPDAPDLPGEQVAGSLAVDGLQRSWQAYVPASLHEGAPLLILLHGSMGEGGDMRSMTFWGFDVLAERQGLVVAYPDGFERHWNDCRASASYSANTRNIDDVGFLRALIAELIARYGSDPDRVWVAGLSNGGQMAYRMGLEAPDAVAGIAAFAANLPVAENLDCRPSGRAVSTLIVNGTEDPINPYDGGLVEVLGDASRGTVRSSRESIAYWAELAGYTGAGEAVDWPDAVDDGTTVSTLQWSAPGRPALALVTVHGGGHTMPDPVFRLPRALGRTSHELDSARLVWEFFGEGRLQPPAPE